MVLTKMTTDELMGEIQRRIAKVERRRNVRLKMLRLRGIYNDKWVMDVANEIFRDEFKAAITDVPEDLTDA